MKLAGRVLNKEEIAELISEIEGHPDNVLPAFLGGMVVSAYQDKQLIHSKG